MPWMYSCAHSQEGRQPTLVDYIPSIPPKSSRGSMQAMMARGKRYIPPPDGVPER